MLYSSVITPPAAVPSPRVCQAPGTWMATRVPTAMAGAKGMPRCRRPVRTSTRAMRAPASAVAQRKGTEAAEARPAADSRHQFRVPCAEPSDPCESKADDENAAATRQVPGDIPVTAKKGDEGRGSGDRQHDGIGNPLPAHVLDRRDRDEDQRHKGDVIHPSSSPHNG